MFDELLERGHVLSPPPHQVQRLAVARPVGVLRRTRRRVDAGEASEIDRVGRGGPGSAEELRIDHLEPQRAPAARRVTGQKAGVRRRNQAEAFLEMRDELLGERAAPRAVVGRIGELMVTAGKGAVEIHADHRHALSLARLADQARALAPRRQMIAAESVNHIAGRVAAGRLFVIAGRQHHAGAHDDRPPPIG